MTTEDYCKLYTKTAAQMYFVNEWGLHKITFYNKHVHLPQYKGVVLPVEDFPL